MSVLLARLRLSPLQAVALVVILLAVLVGIFADLLVPHDPTRIAPRRAGLPPAFMEGGSPDFLLGTDRRGRDMLSRIIVGTRVSLGVAGLSILLGGGIGALLGLLAGYLGGKTDAVIMRLCDAFLAFPSILIALLLAVTIGPSFEVVVLVLALILWARFARLVRAQALVVRGRDFVAAARISGASAAWVIRRHLLPNVINSIVVLLVLQIGWAIVMEASLTFLGAGVPPPTPTWGGMIAEGLNHIETQWWISVLPGLAIVIVVFAFNVAGDWLRDLLDPKLRNL